MSNYTPPNLFSSTCVDLYFVREKIQNSLNNNYDDNEYDIENLIRYYVPDIIKVKAKFLPKNRLYVVKFLVKDFKNHKYQYRFFVNSRRS